MKPFADFRTRAVMLSMVAVCWAMQSAGGQVPNTTMASGAVTGQLFDRNNNRPVVDARIVLRPSWNRSIQLQALTDSTGTYSIADLRFGNYVFAISRLGYAAVELDILIDRSEPISLSVGLSPLPVALPPVNVETDPPVASHRITAGGPPVISRRNTITESEIEEHGLTHRNALAIIRRLRPGWLTTRGDVGTASARGNNQVVLYVDGVRRGEVEDAQNIDGGTVARIFLFDAIEATQRWGTGHVAGAINLILKPPTN